MSNKIAALGALGAALHVSSVDYKSSRAGEGAYFHDDVDKHRALLKIGYDGPGKVIGNDVRDSERTRLKSLIVVWCDFKMLILQHIHN